MSLRAAAAVAAAIALPAAGAPEEFDLDPGHTFPSFAVGHLGISTQRGRFERTAGRIVLDREAGTGSVEVAITAASVTTGNPKLDAVVRGEDFLDAPRHPAITFRSRAVAFEGGVPRRVAGDLTLAGVTRPVELAVTRFGCTRLPFLVRETCGADLAARIRRSEFGITAFAGLVADEVAIDVQVEAVRREPVPAPAPPGG
ncbi:MAG: polyisoprenoid-binding protein [Burkholderiales bacterium]|nr:polyisoprenoid-binding protein [Burkholderiales bacterium]MBX3717732.1 polyisoprenoid-binding protein [Burkholderiales bacterium]